MAAISADSTTSATGVSPLRRLLTTAVVAMAAFGVLQYFASTNDEDPAVREAWLQDATAIIVLALLATVIAAVVIRSSYASSATAQKRATLGLAIGALIAAPLFWYSAAPLILAAGAFYFGSATGVTARGEGSAAVRTTVLVTSLIVLASVALVLGATVAEML